MRPSAIRVRFWVGAGAIVLALLSPMIISDLEHQGDNIQRLLRVTQSEESSPLTWPQKISKTIYQHGEFYWLAFTSMDRNEFPWSRLAGNLFVASGVLVALYLFKPDRRFFSSLPTRHPLTVLMLLWLGIFFLLYCNVADRLGKPRFWLMSGMLPFFFVGLWLSAIEQHAKRMYFSLAVVGMLLLIGWQLLVVASFFKTLHTGREARYFFRTPNLDVFEQRVTLGNMHRVTDWMAGRARSNDKGVCFFATDAQLREPYEQLLQMNHPTMLSKRWSVSQDSPSECSFFLIGSRDNDKDVPRNISAGFIRDQSLQDGATEVWELHPKDSD